MRIELPVDLIRWVADNIEKEREEEEKKLHDELRVLWEKDIWPPKKKGSSWKPMVDLSFLGIDG